MFVATSRSRVTLTLNCFVVCLLIPFSITSEAIGQPIPSEVKKELKKYRLKVEELGTEYQHAIIGLRTELDLKLSTIAKQYLDDGKPEIANKIATAKSDLNPPTSIDNRLKLRQELVGKRFRWRGKGGATLVWKFEADGTIVTLSEGDAIYPWVAISANEALLILPSNTLRILRFNEKRDSWVALYLPKAKPVGDPDVHRIK